MKLLKKLVTLITVVTIFAYVSGWVINYRGAEPSPEYLQLMRIEQTIQPPDAEGNALLYLAGFGAEKAEDVLKEGEHWLASDYRDYKAPVDFGGIISEKFPKSLSCESDDCILDKQAVKNRTNKINQLFPDLLMRYEKLLSYSEISCPYVQGIVTQTPLTSLNSLREAQTTYLLSLFSENSSLAEKTKKLANDYQFWKNMMKSSNNGLMSAVFIQNLGANIMYGLQLKRHFPKLQLPQQWYVALTISDINFSGIMFTDAHTYFFINDDINSLRKQSPLGIGTPHMSHFEPQDSKNFIAKNAMNLINFYANSSLGTFNSKPELVSSDWWNLRNLFGKYMFNRVLEAMYNHKKIPILLAETEKYRQKITEKLKQ